MGWCDWLKNDEETRKTLGISKSKGSFVSWIEKSCPWFWWMQNLTNGTKHFSRDLPFKPLRVSLLPSARNLPNAGADDSHWDGPMPYLTAGPDVLIRRHMLRARKRQGFGWTRWLDTLREAYALAKKNDGAPGSDGMTFAAIEAQGVEVFLEQIADELSVRLGRRKQRRFAAEV